MTWPGRTGGKYVQGFPEYDPERMGAPITVYNRISDGPCTVHSNIYTPDYVMVDESLLASVDVTAGLNVIHGPLPRGWQYSAELLPELCKMAVETCVWSLYEVIEDRWFLNYEPKRSCLSPFQGRFKHCFKPGNERTLEAAQAYVDEKWEKLLVRCI